MKFLMLVATDPERGQEDPESQSIEAWVEENDERGRRLLGERLRPATEAVVVRRRGGRLQVTDGPFAESHEWVVGFDVLECASTEEAVEIASRHPMAATGRLELRALWED